MIRLAEARDEAAIRDCAAQAYARYVPRIGREPAPMLADYASQIAAGRVHVSESDTGAFQGFIVFVNEDRHVLLENVAVLPEAAGQGIGKALIAFCEAAARAGGKRAVRLYTNAAMTENLSIYPRLGYIEYDRRVEDGFDRVCFEKILR
ncbi:GNAT family N-acetyltransferase [Rhodobacter sp. NTK016B]|uniref:GNAT family N-acetyltransferase n=1 Tax=Rhodobacter sp. NTK016B TaxID=2759676 RepID=UPI001A8E2456|nr:GNAT family N-acetyltransferase [Rhodobacter sp. NTK016B]MBN8291596.1 GNAT family N-acetyltransferase [Rhodobacter sp. NTK016B]